HDRPTRLVDAGEVDVGPEGAIGFGGGRLRLRLGDERSARAVSRALSHYSLLANFGTMAVTGSPRCCSTSSGVLSVRSKNSRPRAAPRPRTSPAMMLSPRFQNVRGRIGTVGAVALSTRRMLLVSSPPVTAVSFKRLATES